MAYELGLYQRPTCPAGYTLFAYADPPGKPGCRKRDPVTGKGIVVEPITTVSGGNSTETPSTPGNGETPGTPIPEEEKQDFISGLAEKLGLTKTSLLIVAGVGIFFFIKR